MTRRGRLAAFFLALATILLPPLRNMFHITWNLSEADWEKARRASSEHEPGSQYDRECSAHYYLLFATVSVRSDGGSLFERNGTDAISVSVLDIGHQLARVIADVERTGRGQFSASDDDNRGVVRP